MSPAARGFWWSLAVTAFLVLVLLLAGCASEGNRERLRPAPSSSRPKSHWSPIVKMWLMMDPDSHSWSHVKGTGSMAPYIDSKSVLLLERVEGKDVKVGDVILFDDLNGGTVCHSAREVNERGAVLTSGDNLDGLQGDGWIAASRIRWRVAGNLNTNGLP